MNFENIYQQLNSKGINACFNKKGDSIIVFNSNKNEIATIESMPSDELPLITDGWSPTYQENLQERCLTVG